MKRPTERNRGTAGETPAVNAENDNIDNNDSDGGVAGAAETAIEAAPAAPEPADSLAPAPGEDFQAGESEPAEPPSPEQQIAALKDQLLRSMAETENVRRRAERERDEARKYAVTGLARDLVGIVDNLRRAIAAAPPPDEEGDGVFQGLLTGVEMTERELLAVLQRHDIRAINPIGEKFNPNYHQAMFEVPDSGQAPGTVVEVTEVGYAIAERLLRPAAVGVAAASKDEAVAPTRTDTTV